MKFSFSLDTVDVYNQAPNRNKRECRYYWEDEIFKLLPAAGFNAVELPYDLKWGFGGRTGIPLTEAASDFKYGGADGFKAFLKSRGIDYVTGMQFDPCIFSGGDGVNILEADSDSYFGAFEHFAGEVIRYAANMGCETVTLSASGTYYSLKTMAADEDKFFARTGEVFMRLAAMAEEKGMKLCIKNEYWSVMRGEKIIKLLEKLPKNVYYGIDTANLTIAGVDPVKFVEKVAGRIGSVMLTDTAFVDDVEAWKQGLPEFPAARATKVFRDLGEGTVDNAAVCKALEKAGYDGWVVVNNRNSYLVHRGMLRARLYIDNEILKG